MNTITLILNCMPCTWIYILKQLTRRGNKAQASLDFIFDSYPQIKQKILAVDST